MTILTAPLVGMKFHPGAAEALLDLGFGDPLTLVREPENPHDGNAIKVFAANGVFLGYIKREFAADWQEIFDGDDLPEATLTFESSGWPQVSIDLEGAEARDEVVDTTEFIEEESDALPESERGEI